MSLKYPLNETLSPIDREGRNRLNENWTRIMAYFDHVQLQIKALAGGHEVDELIARLEQAIANAETDLQNYIAQVDTTVQEAIDANNTATQDAIAENNTALQIALDKVTDKLLEVNQAIENADTSAEGANAAKQGALDATAQAKTAITDMQSLINNTVPRGIWNNTTQYFKNNMATYNGSVFIALQDNLDKAPPTLPTSSNAYWSLFVEKGATGGIGPPGLPGKDGKDGTGVNIIGSLASEADLPQTGSPGDAYMIGGDLYVWQANLNNWKNVGPIQGPEGKSAYDLAVQNGFVGTMEEWLESLKGGIGPPGPDGPQGPPGKDADLTEVNQEIANIKQTVSDNKMEVTEHLGQMATTEVAGHVMLVNDLITGGADKAASADTVKALKTNQDMIEQTLGSKFHVAIDYFSGDLDVLKKDGFYKGYNFTNGAEISISVILVKSYSPDWIVQIQYTVGTRPLMYIRAFHSGTTWTAWNRIMDKIDYDQLFTSVSNGKATVNQAVTDMGVYTAPDAPFATTAANIKVIPKGKTVQESTMNVPSFSGTGQVQVDVTFAGGTVRNAMVQCGGVLFIHGLYYGNAQVSSGLYVSNIEFIGSTVRFTFRLGSGLGNWVGGSIRYTITS
ncbi:hypothetical protein OCI51_26520 (plasmid) [Lysinibacillus capsici]|uniref:hypothetical protein n=1 Tax=Lysinibacillus capsici TaxID=2115968 RepID=UPI0021D7DAC0|nr:hypothetical protein [Lysinibacillus capsici]UYB50163.1 hypothetical protein OCI51_26895 [Lysinibacillus capsici]UYB50240.1 hypothetical protein OCI51_26520 [Lysinibacillus capsici]